MAEIEAFDNARPLQNIGQPELAIRKGADQAPGAAQAHFGGANPLDNVQNPAKEIVNQIRANAAAYGIDPNSTDAEILAMIGDVKAQIATDADGKYEVESYVHSTGMAPNIRQEVKLRAVMQYTFTLTRPDNGQPVNCDMKAWRYTSEPEIALDPTDMETLMGGPAEQLREARLNHMERALALLEADARAFEAGMASGDAQAQALRLNMIGRENLDSSVTFDSKQHDHVLIKHEFKGAVGGLPPVAFPVEQIAKRHFGQMMAEAKREREEARAEGRDEPAIEPRRITFRNPQHAETGERLRSLAKEIVDGQDLGRRAGGGAGRWIDERVAALDNASANWAEIGSHLNTAIRDSERMEALRQEPIVEAYLQIKTAAPGAAPAQERQQALAFAAAMSAPGARERLSEYLEVSEKVRERLDSPDMRQLRAATAELRGQGPLINAVKQRISEPSRNAMEHLDRLNTDGALDTAIGRLTNCPRVLGQAADEVIPRDEIRGAATREMEQMDDITNEIAAEEIQRMNDPGTVWDPANRELSDQVHTAVIANYESELENAQITDLAKDMLRARAPGEQHPSWDNVEALVNDELSGQAANSWPRAFQEAFVGAYIQAVQNSGQPEVYVEAMLLDNHNNSLVAVGDPPGAAVVFEIEERVRANVLPGLEFEGAQRCIDAALVATVLGPGRAVDEDSIAEARLAMSPRAHLAAAFARTLAEPADQNQVAQGIFQLGAGTGTPAASNAVTGALQDGLTHGNPYTNPDEYSPESLTALRGLWKDHPDCQQAWAPHADAAARRELTEMSDLLFGDKDVGRVTQATVDNLARGLLDNVTYALGLEDDAQRTLADIADQDPGGFRSAFTELVGTPGAPSEDTQQKAMLGMQILADKANLDPNSPDQALDLALANDDEAKQALDWVTDAVCDWVGWEACGDGNEVMGAAFKAKRAEVAQALIGSVVDGWLAYFPNRVAE